MIFLISLGTASLFILMAGRTLQARPVSFYLGAVGIALAAVSVTWGGVTLPAGFAEHLWPMVARGGLAGALFVIVMFTGAFPNGSMPIKKLMPIRGQLSIVASILTLGHNAAYGRVYFIRLLADPAIFPIYQRLAAACSALMLAIMLPLFLTSFRCVRKRIAPKRWKRIQRMAYGFYGLLACHIMLLTLPGALRGDRADQVSACAYGAVFLTYLLCRAGKAYAKGKMTGRQLAGRQAVAGICCALLSVGAVFGMRVQTAGKGFALAEELPENSAAMPEAAKNAAGKGNQTYRDGVYAGSAMGMNALIEVSVTVEDGEIVDISIVSAREDEPYFSSAQEVIDDVIVVNGTQVDTVSGATYSSGGILDAVDDALGQAGD